MDGNGMDIFVRNLPQAITEKQVEKFFRPHFAKFSIETFSCRVFKGKGSTTTSSAAITILDVRKATSFLNVHGQRGEGRDLFGRVQPKLFHMGKPIYCSQSTQPPDRYILRALEKDEKEKLNAVSRQSKPKSRTLKRKFDITTLYCGQWDYVKERLVFVTQFQEHSKGTMMFGRQSVVIILHPTHSAEKARRVEMPFFDIESFTIGNSSNPTATFALGAPPKLFEDIERDDSLVERMRELDLGRKPVGFKRMRIMALRRSHEVIVSSCLCYRIMLKDPSDIVSLQYLRRAQEIPESRVWDTKNILKEDFLAQLTLLNNALSRVNPQKVSFDVKFQLQRLAQNGVIPPDRVTELLGYVSRNFSKVDDAILVASIRKLYLAIPYAGPGTEASEFSEKTLSNRLTEFQQSAALEDSNSHLAEKYEHIALIHKATVTPVGIILSGPEPETINRVIRKQVYLTPARRVDSC